MSEKWRDNKKLFWKEIKRVRGDMDGNCRRKKDERGVVLRGKGQVLVRWKEHFG